MKYSLNDKIGNETVKQIIDKNKKEIFNFLKNGYDFDDDVLVYAHIKKTVTNEKYTNVIVEHEKSTKVYEKETDSLNKILKDILTIDKTKENVDNYE